MLLESLTLAQILSPKQPEIPPPPEPPAIVLQISEKPKINKYTVKRGDTLTKIAKKHKITVQHLWAKNKKVKHQDELSVGAILIIPEKDEKLPKRAFKSSTAPIAAMISKASPSLSYVAQTNGNTYGYGYCTWYVKNRKPSIPNGLGNANTWYSRAHSAGLATGTSPRVGAVATTTRGSLGHVAYVERVSGGRIYVAEMNVAGWNVASHAWYPASDYLYIY